MINWQAREFVKERLGNQITKLIKEEKTILDDPVEIEKLLAPIVAGKVELAKRVQKRQRPRSYGKLYFDGTPSDVALLEAAFAELSCQGDSLLGAQIEIERTFVDLVEVHKRGYRSMPSLRRKAKRRLRAALDLASNDIRKRKTALGNQVEAMRTGKNKGCRSLLNKFPDIFLSPVRKKALQSPKTPLAEKMDILEKQIEKFDRRLAGQSDPLSLQITAALRAQRSSPLLDDPIELMRFLFESSNDSLLRSPNPFWRLTRVKPTLLPAGDTARNR